MQRRQRGEGRPGDEAPLHAGLSAGTYRVMTHLTDDSRIHLDVAIQPGAGTIRGTIADGADLVLEFTGWLELMSAFETVRTTGTPHEAR